MHRLFCNSLIFVLFSRNSFGPQCSSISLTCCCKFFYTKVTTFSRRKSFWPSITWPPSTLTPSTPFSCHSFSTVVTAWTPVSEAFSHAISSPNRYRLSTFLLWKFLTSKIEAKIIMISAWKLKSLISSSFFCSSSFLQDLPSFTQSVHRLVNDLRYYRLCNSSLPTGTIKL